MKPSFRFVISTRFWRGSEKAKCKQKGDFVSKVSEPALALFHSKFQKQKGSIALGNFMFLEIFSSVQVETFGGFRENLYFCTINDK